MELGLSSFWIVFLTACVTTIGTACVAFVNHRLTVSRENRARDQERIARGEEHERHARYLAIRVVCVLDAFVRDCAETVSGEGEFDESTGEWSATTDIPRVAFPDDVDWKVVKPDHMYRALTLPNRVQDAEKIISQLAYVTGGGVELRMEQRRHFGKIGLDALQLAQDLRDSHGIPPLSPDSWDTRRLLVKALEKVAECYGE